MRRHYYNEVASSPKKGDTEPAKAKQKLLLQHVIDVAMGSSDGDGGVINRLQSELSGVRDGDVSERGGDVGSRIRKLMGACREWQEWESEVRRARRVLEENENPTGRTGREMDYDDDED